MFKTGAPLYDALTAYLEKGRASFHTPGHKGHAGILGGLHLLEDDLTELPDTASLYDGGDTIEQAEKLAASAFGAAETLFSAGGCTLCIQSMLFLGAGAGGRVVFARNSHRSAINAAALLGLEPIWAWPTGANGQITVKDIKDSLSSGDNIRAVYITSPDYYGNLADIPAISTLCKNKEIPLLVDNAHGSHLGAFGLHPLALGASMTADSSHKTLPVLTGGAMLHIGPAPDGSPLYNRQSAKTAMALFGSTSPGFPVLASLDLARDWWNRAGKEAYRHTADMVQTMNNTAISEHIAVPKGLRDPARLTLDTSPLGVDGLQAAEFFRSQGCEPEYADVRFVVFIVTPFNTPEELECLHTAIKKLPAEQRRGHFIKKRDIPRVYEPSGIKPAAAMSPREALMKESEAVPVHKAEGRVAARSVCPCPPGIPAVVPGEIIDGNTAQRLSACGYSSLVVLNN